MEILKRVGAVVLVALSTLPLWSALSEAEAEQVWGWCAEEIERGNLAGVSVALVRDQEVVLIGGVGLANKGTGVRATSNTVYRAGSISKVLTATAVMRLVQDGKVDLDAPIREYSPEFAIVQPFEEASPITLRQLLCHRSGIVREPPVGSYFDISEPGIDATIRSLAGCVLVYPPGTKSKYSNAGLTVAGGVVEDVIGEPFEVYMAREWLQPMGMEQSAFMLTPELRRALAMGYMPVAQVDGSFREVEAPVFELGTVPAGNLYTTAEDLAQFLRFLFAGGQISGSALLKPEQIEAMWQVQLAEGSRGFGLGFYVGEFRGLKSIGHNGAVYGFTSALLAIPEKKIGVVVLNNDDVAVASVEGLARRLLGFLAGFKEEEKSEAVGNRPGAADLEKLAGAYESESYWAELDVRNGELVGSISGQPIEFEWEGAESRQEASVLRFRGSGRLLNQGLFSFELREERGCDRFSGMGQEFRRVTDRGRSIPSEWRDYLGSYGLDFIPTIVLERYGRMYAMTENLYEYRLTPLNRQVFKMPPGLYTDEQIVFQRGADGAVHGMLMANVYFERLE